MVTSPVAAPAAAAPGVPADAMARLGQLTEKTGMNQEFAKQLSTFYWFVRSAFFNLRLFFFSPFRCLEVSAWDLEKAFVAFQTAHREGKIPAEAFVK